MFKHRRIAVVASAVDHRSFRVDSLAERSDGISQPRFHRLPGDRVVVEPASQPALFTGSYGPAVVEPRPRRSGGL